MVFAVLVVLVPARPAWGQSRGDSGCGGGPGLMTAEVTIDQPAPNAVVAGKNVVVRGSAQASLGQLSRVEVTLAGRTQVETSSPSSSIDYEVSFDVTNVPAGETSLQVVACGAFSLAGSLARGEAEITVRVQPPPTASSTTAVPRTTVVGAGGAGARPSAAGAGGPTTSVAVTTTVPGQSTASSSTTVTSTPAGQENAASSAQARAEPARPQASDAPLVLTDAPEDGSDRPPLWVGGVVGISGGLGLLFSAKSSRRRSRLPEAAEPLEPAEAEGDLVDVR